ncbi:ribonuclease HI [Rhizobium sp. NFR07]|nr:ribonuclease HI [Rhizobium sp. NFR07]
MRSRLMIELFADGSFDPDLRVGSWAFVAYREGLEVFHQSGSSTGASNNHFEVLAVLKATEWAVSRRFSGPVLIWTDSHYVMKGVHRLLPIWRNNGWRKVDRNPRNRKRPSPDRAIWQVLDRLLGDCPSIVVDWCKAHNGLCGNDRADFLAGVGRVSNPADRSDESGEAAHRS